MRMSVLVLAGAALALAACDQNDGAATGEAPPPSVVTAAVQSRDVSASIDYIGRSEASQRVDIRARVTGFLDERPFMEGSRVASGDVLFRIDPAEFDANRAAALADIARADAAIEEAGNNLARYERLLERDVASVANFDEAKAADGRARADRAAADAALQKADLDVAYTTITAPIDGRIGRASADVGNLIGPDSGVLATINRLDPIYIVFSIGEREYLEYSGAAKEHGSPVVTPRIRLATGEIYAHEGTFDLFDNEVDPTTGTLPIRLSFPNPDALILPGQFVNVILTSTNTEERVVIPQAAVQENQTGPFVLVVDAENRVEARPIITGQRIGADIVAQDGLSVGETIIVEGIQKTRPGGTVVPTPQSTAAVAE